MYAKRKNKEGRGSNGSRRLHGPSICGIISILSIESRRAVHPVVHQLGGKEVRLIW